MQLPHWIDTLIFDELKANHCPQRSDMTNIDNDKAKTLNYLGTYFPRSYVEAYCIFDEKTMKCEMDVLVKLNKILIVTT